MLPYATWYPTYSTTPLFTIASKQNVEISGGGSIDGQGAAWYTSDPGSGLYMIYFTSCNTVLIQNITISNSPAQQIVFKGSKGGNITIQGLTINTPSSHATPAAKNTDGIDLVGTNCLIQNCSISTGDDNIALGTSSSGVPASDILVTNCAFGTGHGMTIGSNTAGGVSNLMVINCTFNGTDYGIRMKSDNATSGGGGEGGVAQNLSYFNLGMTNIIYQPILIYSYYNEDSSPTGITPATAAGETVGSSLYPIWQNIVISNLTATVGSGGGAGMIWGRIEAPATNITLKKINITAPANFNLYNVKGLQIVDTQITPTGGGNTFSIYNAQFTITNSAPVANVFSMDGLAGTNSLALYNTKASMSDSAAIGINPLTLSSSTLSNGTSLTLPAASVVNFVLGNNNATVAVTGNLSLNSTINISTNTGFGPSTNTLFTYTTGSLTGTPVLGTTPGGYNYALNTSTAGQVRLVVTSTNSSSTPITTTNTIQSLVNPSTYGSAVMFTATVSPAPTNGETVTFKDGSTTLGTGTLSGGQATFNTTATQLAATSHAITAVYVGDGAYNPSTSSVLTQTVNPLGLTVSGLTINNKVYDGATAATLNTNGYVLNTVIGGDSVMLVTNGYTAFFASPNVANGIAVTVNGLSLGGAQAGNYSLAQPTGLSGNITPAGSSILLVSSANPVANLSAVSFTASVTPPTLSGSVLFLTNGVAFDSEPLSGGSATSVPTTQLPRGTSVITAQYSGSANYSPGTNTLNQVVTNNPPVANPATYYRLAGSPLTILIANLATNWSDLDGDPLTLTSVDTTSTNGGTVTYDSTNIYYSDTSNVTDQFGYTISDGQGGTAQGIVTVLMAQQNISGWTFSNGTLTLNFTGIPNSVYWVEAATNLASPVDWTPISTNVAGSDGQWQFTDTQTTNFLRRFYRTQANP
jgi:hypothetical protein